MQILANRAKHVDAVPDFVERMRNETLTSLARFCEGVTQIEVPAQRPNVDRGQNMFGIIASNGARGVGIPASSFEASVLDGRPLSWRGSRG
jgi:hypothetical protein